MRHDTLTLADGDSPFCQNPADSFTLPARFYIDNTIFENELDAIFYRSWWYAGHVSQLTNSGDYLTANIGDQNVFIVRDRNNDLRAFYNVCKHRGHELIQGEGTTGGLVCPYHAWSYQLDGKLKRAPHTGNLHDFDIDKICLDKIQVEEFCGFVYVNLDSNAPSLKSQSSNLSDEIHTWAQDIDRLTFAHRLTYNIRSNWKNVVDNFRVLNAWLHDS